ncbi:MAG: lysophospholipid acyltransferase family protein [Fuerstiella sp.]|nr:lysophospholipid acyltransferase family protein [Fuerstiella sp.]MCP4506998.1 lysophospholipid acyltransferase family protein [Fuerstiella sp.]
MKIRNQLANWLIARIGTWCLRALFLTVRVEHHKVETDGTPYGRAAGPTRFCFCMWHDAIVTAVYSLKTDKLAGLISRHQDGGYLAHAVKLAGITPVRGSASRGGAQATKQLIDQPDLHVCITPDGPRGPRRVMKDGVVYLSSRTGRPVIPTTLTGTNYWSVPGGWSDMMVPKPFSKMILLAGPAIEVDPNLNREQISEVTETIQKEMDRLDLLGQRLIRGDRSVLTLLGRNGTYPDDAIPAAGAPEATNADRTDDADKPKDIRRVA